MKRILAMLLSVICVLSFTCVSTYADEKSEDEEKAASIAESYLSAAAKNMWLYESNNLAEHTIQELVDPSGNSLLSDMSADVNTQKILSSMDNITFVQEKSKYFREMRQRQDIQRNDFALEYTVTSASIEDNVATLSIIEHISFHYSSFPDTLSELVNYYDVDLIKCNGSWYVSDVTSTNDDFDAIYKGSEFTAENAELDILLEENEIDHILRGEDKDATPKIVALIEQESQEFINDLLSGLRERMIELKSGKVVFLGGGAKLLRRQIEVSGKIRQATFVEDINANAKGYEYLYRLQHGVR